MDYSKFEHLDEEQIRASDLGQASAKKPRWAHLIEEDKVEALERLVETGELPVNDTRWRGTRHTWRTAGNFADESETGEYTPLGYACCWNKPAAVAVLLKAGADKEATIVVNGNERTPLSIARSRNMKKIMALLK